MSKELTEVSGVIGVLKTYGTSKMQWKLNELPDDVLGASAEELEDSQEITDTDKKIRIQLHSELGKAVAENRKVRVSNICEGICHPNHFLKLIEDPKKLGWYVLPYQHEELRVQHQVVQAQDSIDEFLSLPIRKPNGDIDYKAAQLRWSATKLVYERRYPERKINENFNRNNSDAPQGTENPQDLTERIRKLEEELGKG